MDDVREKVRRPGGRPPRVGVPRHFLSLRLPISLKDRLVSAAVAHKRAVTQEIVRRLERSFWEDEVGLQARLRLEAMEEFGRLHCPGCHGTSFVLYTIAEQPVADLKPIGKVECAGCRHRFKVRFGG